MRGQKAPYIFRKIMTIKELYSSWVNFQIANLIEIRFSFWDNKKSESVRLCERINRKDFKDMEDIEDFIFENYGNEEVSSFMVFDSGKVVIYLKFKI